MLLAYGNDFRPGIQVMKFKYKSGEEIKKGDRVLLHGKPGEVEFVVEELTGDLGMDWYMEEFGGGVMIKEPEVFGRCFIHDTTVDLDFVSRA
jgi:hypothetical protein